MQTSTVGLWLVGDHIAGDAKAVRAVHDEPVRTPKWTTASLTAYEELLSAHVGIDELTEQLQHENDPDRRTVLERAIEHHREAQRSLELQLRLMATAADRSDGWGERHHEVRQAVDDHRRRSRSKPFMLTTTTQWPPLDFPPAYEGNALLITRGDSVRVVVLETTRNEATGRWGWIMRTKRVKGVLALWPKALPEHVSVAGSLAERVTDIADHLRHKLRPAT